MSTTVRIRPTSLEKLKRLARQHEESVQDTLDKAIEQYRRQKLLEQINADYAALRGDPEAWQETQRERQVWEGTLMDGLEPGERWAEDGSTT